VLDIAVEFLGRTIRTRTGWPLPCQKTAIQVLFIVNWPTPYLIWPYLTIHQPLFS